MQMFSMSKKTKAVLGLAGAILFAVAAFRPELAPILTPVIDTLGALFAQ